MTYPNAPHIRFPFTRPNAQTGIDGGTAAATFTDAIDGGGIGTLGAEVMDGGGAFVGGATGGISVVEQDTEDHVMSCVNVIVRCPQGFRDDRPEFGWPWPDLTNIPLDVSTLELAIATFEPRATADATQYADAAIAAMQHVRVLLGVQSPPSGEITQ